MRRILIRHLNGRRANEIDSFPADFDEDLIAGRDPLAAIHFDPEQDDLVSRQHVRISKDPDNPNSFRLVDLQSRNGTFVNHRRVYGSTFLNHYDRVQLGPSGPEFRFELDPPPSAGGRSLVPQMGMEVNTLPLTREVFSHPANARELGTPAPRPIGRATVEGMLDDTFGLLKQESNKALIVGLVCIFAILLTGFGVWMYMKKSSADVQLAEQQTRDAVALHSEQAEKRNQENLAHLGDQLREQQQRNDAAMKQLTQKLAEATRRLQAAELAQRKLLQQALASSGTVQQPASLGGNPTYGQLVDRVDGLIKQNKYSDAAEIARQMMQADPSRYEGYFFGGVSALHQQQLQLAKSLLKQAMAKAPAEMRDAIRQLLTTAQNIDAQEK